MLVGELLACGPSAELAALGDLWRRMVESRLTKEVLCLKLASMDLDEVAIGWAARLATSAF